VGKEMKNHPSLGKMSTNYGPMAQKFTDTTIPVLSFNSLEKEMKN
jgi:hypothetical protein